MKRILFTLLVCAWSAVASAQTYTLAPAGYMTLLDNSGRIAPLGCIWTYLAGTTTPAATFSDNIGTSNTNPIKADAAARFTAYLTAGVSYKFIYESACTPPAHGTVYRTADNISGVPSSAFTVDVTATAGETISAGQAAYLSDGSGGKTAGQWYRADNTAAYSSLTNMVGIAPSAIATSSSGTVRIQGPVMGLTALSVGQKYYVGVSGALVTSVPNFARLVGQADSATSMVVAAVPPPGTGSPVPGTVCGRLTLTTGVPVTTTDVTAATTVYFTPVQSCNQITLYNGTNLVTDTLTEVSIAVPASTTQMYDVFALDTAGVVSLELLAWTNDTTRATAVTLQNGFLAKAATPTRRYLGSVRTTGVSGQTEDSAAKRYLWNYYNRARRPLLKAAADANWTYSTATVRQANANAANQVEVIVGIAEVPIEIDVTVVAENNNGTCYATVSIGEDSTSAVATGVIGGGNWMHTAFVPTVFAGRLNKYPVIGRHFYAWLEFSQAFPTTTWIGTWATTPIATPAAANGLSGWIEG